MNKGKTTTADGAAPMDPLWQEHGRPERAEGEPALVIDVGGFEGPLDLLLHLARAQKVDLARISILALAEQYLEFVDTARQVRIELAADYLVMAAWLAYLKSRLLIPQQAKDEGPSGEEMAATLAFRLKRLEAMRDAATRLVNRNRLGRDVFARGAPEHIADDRKSVFEATLYDLLTAYAAQRQRQAISNVTIAKRGVWSLKDASGAPTIQRLIAAVLSGTRRRLDDATLLRLLATHPLLTLKVTAAIHWHALRLLAKRIPWWPHPAPPAQPFSPAQISAPHPKGSMQR